MSDHDWSIYFVRCLEPACGAIPTKCTSPAAALNAGRIHASRTGHDLEIVGGQIYRIVIGEQWLGRNPSALDTTLY